jgi:hypothetical protein
MHAARRSVLGHVGGLVREVWRVRCAVWRCGGLQVAALRGRAELYTVARAADSRGPSLGGLKYRARMAG